MLVDASYIYNYLSFLESRKRNYENVLEQNKEDSYSFGIEQRLETKTKVELLDIIDKEIRMLILGEKY